MALIHRKAKPVDVDAIVDRAVESVSKNPIPVRVSRKAIRVIALQTLNPAHFPWLAEKDGAIVPAVAAQGARLRPDRSSRGPPRS